MTKAKHICKYCAWSKSLKLTHEIINYIPYWNSHMLPNRNCDTIATHTTVDINWYVYNTVCEGWYKRLCSVGGWQGTALTHIELCAKFIIVMVIMEQVGLFNLNKYSYMVNQ